MGLITKDFVVDNWVFTSCWELIEVTTQMRLYSNNGARDEYRGEDEESYNSAHQVFHLETQKEIKELKEKIEEADSEDLSTFSLEEELAELEDSDPPEVLNYWVVSKDLAENHSWEEMGISPPVFEWMGLYIWLQFYSSIREDSFIEALIEHIHSR